MSSLLIVVARAGLLVLVLGMLTLFPWPDITPYFSYLQQLFNMIYLLNPIFDVPTLFLIAGLTLGIELIFLVRKLIVALVHFISSGSFTGGGGAIDNSGGDV